MASRNWQRGRFDTFSGARSAHLGFLHGTVAFQQMNKALHQDPGLARARARLHRQGAILGGDGEELFVGGPVHEIGSR